MYIGGLSVIPLERCHAHVLQAKAVAKSRRYFYQGFSETLAKASRQVDGGN